ncbi:mitochondrial import receptor subunit TOM70-like isoform X2 [Panulirus ornatus]|uniref:mitochondrial import receptor subunit TOM70-like isoform X2 n=1 Tax=Panulirus ornatus TaxID=150431 RepID=UPI003A8B5D1B
MALSKYTTEQTGVPNWKIALAVGGTLAAGVAIYYFLIRETSKKGGGSKTATDKSPDAINSVTSPSSECSSPKADDAVNLTPLEKAQSYKNKGNKYFKGGKYSEAIKCYDQAIETCPPENTVDLSTFYQNRAAAYEQQKNWECVLRDCTAALELNERYVKALQRRAKACEVLKDLDQALEDLTAVCIIESFQNQATLVNVDRVLKELGRMHAKEAMEDREPVMPSKHFIKTFFESFAEDPIFNSVDKEKEGDVDEAEHPPGKNTTNNGYLKARQHLQEGNYGEIIDCCQNELAIPFTPYKVESLLLRATLYQLRGESTKAMEDLTVLISIEDCPLKMQVNALVKRGSLHMQHEKVDSSLKDFDRAAILDPTNSDVFHHRGQIHLLIGKVDAAMSDFKTAVELNSNFPIAFVQRCYTDYRYAYQLGDKAKVEEVMKKFEEAIKNFPKCVECYVLYAQVLCDQGEHERADSYYIKALEVEPDNPTTLVHRALLILQWKGDLAQARSYITQALEIDEKCELAYENLATIEVQTGNLKRGVELFDKAIPLAKTEMEMAHLFSLRDAAVAQLKIVEKMGINIPNLGSL